MDDTKRYQQGMKVRRAVLGDEYVDRAMASTSDFNREFQDFITRNAWGVTSTASAHCERCS